MENNWQKDYPVITDLSKVESDENSSYNKMARFIGHDKYVVDFGCATGYFAQLLTQKGCTVVGVEINPNAAKLAEQYCEKVFIADLDFVSLSNILPEQTFDVAVFGDTLEHLRDPWRILEETKSILKPNGYVVVSIPNIAHGAVRLALLQGRFEYERYGLLDNTHLRFFTRKTLEQLFEQTGYFVDSSDRTIVPIFSGSEFVPLVDPNSFAPEIIEKIEQEEDSDTLQFVFRAFPLTLEGKFTALSNRYGDLLEQYKRLQLNNQSAQTQLGQTQSEIQQLQEKSQSEIQQLREKSQSEIQQLREKSQSEIQYLRTEIERAKADFDRCLSEKEDLQKEFQKSQIQLKNVQTRFQWAQSQLRYAQTGVGTLEARVRTLQGEVNQKQKRLERQRERLDRQQGRIQRKQTEVERLQEDLGQALHKLEAIQTSKFWKMRMAWFNFKRLFGLASPDTELFASRQPELVAELITSIQETVQPEQKNLKKKIAVEQEQESLSDAAPTAKMFAFISDCPGDAYRYRCQHQAEMLEYLGYTVDVYDAQQLPYNKLLKQYRVIVVHRVPHTHAFEQFTIQAKEQGVIVVYETDDLVFEPAWIHHIDAYMNMDEAGQRLYEDGVRRYQQSISLCEYAVVSTDKLKQEIQAGFPEIEVAISRNRISREMEAEADKAQKICLPSDGVLRIAYFSGTKTHAKDFAECVPALRRILQEFSDVTLLIVGHLDLPEELQDFSSQIEHITFVPWRTLPLIYRRADINLAPLEHHNDFTEAKSELKYFEAGLLSVPTVASDLGAFQVAIQDGINGRLCNTPEDWYRALHELITDSELRQRMGQAAFADVQVRYLTRTAASITGAAWQQLIGGNLYPDQPLSIAFVLRAPIAQTGGGYKQIFNLAHYLANQGHDVHIYVEPIAHLTGLSLARIRAFCEENFGRSRATIHRGHEEILDSDVAIATNWPTAYVVDKLTNTRFKAYYVQDYETFFYRAGDNCFTQAEATYDLPLGIIGMGQYISSLLSQRNHRDYPYIDFSLNAAFLAEDPVLTRHENSSHPCSVLFFARPHIPRRNFALGVKALEKLHQEAPDVQIRLYGMEEEQELPFPYENLGILTQVETATAMRSASIHLSFSMTNITTVIFEAMACGCATVEADVPPVRGMVQDGETCLLAKPNVQAVCNALLKLVNNAELRQSIAAAGYNSVKDLTVENMCSQFETILQQYCFQRK